MISVCMATYNGEAWIKIQLDSILEQLGEADEVVLVDDGSTDSTLDVVAAIDDTRIKVYKNSRNLGVDRTFERAISLAQGDLLFLSDQDDIWYPDKVGKVTGLFDSDPTTTLVLSDAAIIDAAGKTDGSTYFGDRGKFLPGVVPNLVKSKFLGCSMAFRAEMAAKSLPFPHPIPGHDMWIGVINEVYGKSRFVDETLIGYRRHGSNASPYTHQGLWQMLVWRWQLLRGLLMRMVRLLVAGK
ncbi:MAG: glycosyltransferase family 2 protein [Pseudomonadota bacterium]